MVGANGSTERNCTKKEKTSAFKEVFQSSAKRIKPLNHYCHLPTKSQRGHSPFDKTTPPSRLI